ncbi:MAG: hypothetical protein ACE5DS_01105 [Kiloniellaceae bacterium]
MKRHFRFASLLGLVLGVAATIVWAPAAQAALKLQLSSGADTVNLTDTDGDGVLNFTGPVGIFNFNMAVGLSKPAIGSAGSPQLHLTSVAVSGVGNGTLTVMLSEIDFGTAASVLKFLTGFGGVTQGDVTLMAFVDTGNTSFGTGATATKIADLVAVPGIGGSYGDGTSAIVPVDSSYSITLVATITHNATISSGGSATTSLDTTISVIEPRTLMLFGMGLLGLGLIWRRRRVGGRVAA